ncbi:ABC transporter permease [Phytomonospora endophytica]|uniref:ABC-type transport system involved in multi-copper enzyme maturation permease subunit n=1 Tax=Phytomonospora endophytica TaxID=714109 RepID=A0A841FIE9_9ACTN|nr:ABC transporter permease [Phytomonospora endophytica]MBB6035535.1 ABC-type transport system involved in multi-copper enzyme maturation permease subunit [Phytomonospora endophytica]GIG70102.1 hypothetical protein Pen01_63970 [Phytomonospora endophytica]
MTVTAYRSHVEVRRAAFGRLVRAEWTKFATVPRWMITVTAAILLSVLLSGLVAAGAGENTSNDGGGPPVSADPLQPFQDRGHFVSQRRSGDVDVITRVDSQTGGGDWAKAGLMIRGGSETGAPYAAIVVTPGHGVVLRSGTDVDIAGSDGAAPTWLRLTRSGDKVTALESADGVSWTGVGTVELGGLGDDVLAGLFVAAPDEVVVTRQFGTEAISGNTAYTTATFDNVTLTGGATSDWTEREHPSGPAVQDDTTGFTVAGGVYTVTGSGDLGPDLFSPDSTRMVLNTVLVGLCATIALAVLFITSEYRRGMIRTTFLVSPSRGRVLLAKATVIGGVGFAAGLLSALGSLLAAKAMPGGLPLPDLFAWPVVRATLGSGVLVAAAAVFALALGSLIRRSAVAIAVALLALLVPQVAASGLPLDVANWMERLSPAAGFAVQQTVPRYDVAIGPEAGIAVLCAYAAIATGFALWSLKRRDA